MIIATLIAATIGILLAGCLNGARISLILADRKKIQAQYQNGEKWASKALSIIAHPAKLFHTSRVGVELSMLSSGTLVLWMTLRRWGWVGCAVSLLAFFWGFLFVGELLPRAFVAKQPTRLAPFMTRLISLANWLFSPWILIQRLAATLDFGTSEGEGLGDAPSISRQELTWLIRGEEEDRKLLQEERKMIARIFQFSEAEVREAMVPLIEVTAVEETASVGDVIRKVDEEGFSRFPVYQERIDHIFGIVHSFDFLGASSLDESVAPYVRQAPFIPESMPVDELMLQLQHGGNHMAIVVDEYGGSVGIVTVEDLLEEIVGEIQDEFDIKKRLYRKLSPHQFLMQARMEIDALNELLRLEIPKEDCETLGGFLLKAFKRIPGKGESLIFKDVRYSVQKADERSIQEVLITLPRKGRAKRKPRDRTRRGHPA